MSRTTIVAKSAQQRALDLVQSEFRDYHPLIALARMAHNPAVLGDPKLELEVHKSILPYVQPKLASFEVKEEGSADDRRVIVSLFEDVEVREIEDGTVRTVPVQIPMVVEADELVPLD